MKYDSVQYLWSKIYSTAVDSEWTWFFFLMGVQHPGVLPPYQLGTHRLPLLKYLAWSCDHSSSDSRDRGRAFGHRVPTMEHCTSYLSKLRVLRPQLLAHIVRRMDFNPQLADYAARIQLGVASRCTTPSENKPTPPPDANKKRGSYEKP